MGFLDKYFCFILMYKVKYEGWLVKCIRNSGKFCIIEYYFGIVLDEYGFYYCINFFFG